MTPVVVLAGFMGSGKSTVGRALATALDVEFVDTDDEIERRAGRSIPDIFEAEGEAAFRALEADVVCDVLATSGGVVALGGGSPTVPEIREALADHHVVHLRIDADTGFARVRGSDRPLLAGSDPQTVYTAKLAERAETYRAAATVEVDATRPVAEIVAAVTAGIHSSRAETTTEGDPR